MTHLSDDTLNELLDEALAPQPRAAVERHLAGCADCAVRLADLRVLFAELAALPEEGLETDLTPLVVSRLKPRSSALPRPVRWLAVLQAAGLVLAGILGWQTAAARLQAFTLPPLPAWSAEKMLDLLSSVFSPPADLTGWLRLPGVPIPALDLPTATLAVCAAGLLLLWLLGNSLLFIPRSRRSS
jgi:anti-sigma factor RsiW